MVVTLTPIFLVLKVPFALLFAADWAADFLYWGVPRNWYSYFVLFQNWWLAIQVAMAQFHAAN